MNEIRMWPDQWGAIASLVGLGLTIIGFAITIIGVWRSKAAAEQARLAAVATRTSLAHYDAISDLSIATAIMEEIKRLQRHGTWVVLPDRYGDLRRKLVAIKSSHAQLSNQQRQVLQDTVETFADLERRIERSISMGGTPPNPAKLNDIVSSRLDEVQAVLLAVQHSLRTEP
jgi:hypothetical protein